jgi:hypothetical protein
VVNTSFPFLIEEFNNREIKEYACLTASGQIIPKCFSDKKF